jgi:hypothetical protein
MILLVWRHSKHLISFNPLKPAQLQELRCLHLLCLFVIVTWHVGIVLLFVKFVTCFIFSADCTYEYSETQCMYVCMAARWRYWKILSYELLEGRGWEIAWPVLLSFDNHRDSTPPPPLPFQKIEECLIRVNSQTIFYQKFVRKWLQHCKQFYSS